MDDDDDEDMASPPLEDSMPREHSLPPHLQNTSSYMRQAPSASPPIQNGVPYHQRQHTPQPQMTSRPGSRNSGVSNVRRSSTNLGPGPSHLQRVSQAPQDANGYSYMRTPPMNYPATQGMPVAPHHAQQTQQPQYYNQHQQPLHILKYSKRTCRSRGGNRYLLHSHSMSGNSSTGPLHHSLNASSNLKMTNQIDYRNLPLPNPAVSSLLSTTADLCLPSIGGLARAQMTSNQKLNARRTLKQRHRKPPNLHLLHRDRREKPQRPRGLILQTFYHHHAQTLVNLMLRDQD